MENNQLTYREDKMIDVVHNEATKLLLSKRPRIVAVIGCDLDVSLCSVLTIGDKVLMEVNGVRTWSSQQSPLVAEEPWVVVSNNMQSRLVTVDEDGKRVKQTLLSGHLVLRHPRVSSDFSLGYKNIMNTGKGGPAVFIETNDAIQTGTLFVILQMVGFYTPENTVADLFPPVSMDGVDDILFDKIVKRSLFENWSRAFRNFKDNWSYKSLKRFALRSGVKVATVKSIQDEDFEAMMRIPNTDLKKMWEECHWLPMLEKQSPYILHNPEATYKGIVTGENR